MTNASLNGLLGPAAVLAGVLLAMPALPAEASDPCQTAGWDMREELNTFRGSSIAIEAGESTPSAPVIITGRLYRVTLGLQTNVQFERAPAKPPQGTQTHAGVLRLNVPREGVYRITVDSPIWIDLLAQSAPLQTTRFSGWHGCASFRKSLEYALKPGDAITLQLNHSAQGTVRVLITPLPPTIN